MKALLHRLGVLVLTVTFGCSGSGGTSEHAVAPGSTDASTLAARQQRTAPVELTLVHLADTHSRISALGPRDPTTLEGTIGGLARAATRIAEIQARSPNTLLVHAGDLFHGDMMFNHFLGVPEFLALCQLGLVAMVPGNHEFEIGFGAPLLAGSLAASSQGIPAAGLAGCDVPLVGTNFANLYAPFPDQPSLPPLGTWILPSRIVERGDVKVGFLGVTLPPDPNTDTSPLTVDDWPTTINTSVPRGVAALKEAGADVIIALAHVGIEKSIDVAHVPGINVVVSGHDHVVLHKPIVVGETVIVSAGAFYEHLGTLQITVDPDLNLVTVGQSKVETLDSSVTPDPYFKAVIGGLEQQISDDMKTISGNEEFDTYHTVVATVSETLSDAAPGNGANRSTPLGNLVTDLYRQAGMMAQAQFFAESPAPHIALEATGFVDGGPLEFGPIVGADVFRLQSYGADPSEGAEIPGPGMWKGMPLVLCQLPAAALPDLLQFGIIAALPQVSGLTYAFDSGMLVDGSVRVAGQPVSRETPGFYWVTTNVYVASLAAELAGIPIDPMLPIGFAYDVLLQGVQAVGTLQLDDEMRVREVKRH